MKNRTRHTIMTGVVILLVGGVVAASAFAGDEPELTAARAYELRMDGKVDEAVKLLRAGLDEYPDSGALHCELARTRLFLLEIEDMQKEAEAAVRCAPDDNAIRYFAAVAAGYALIDAAHDNDQNRMKAMGQCTFDHLEAILAADPDDHEARYLLVQLSIDMAPDVGLAVEGTEAHVKYLEQEDPILGAKARCCLVDDHEQCRVWERIMADYPDDSRALAEAAEGMITIGELELAAATLDRAIELDEKCSYGLLRLGLAHAMQQNWDEALDLTRKYLRTDPPTALKAFAVGRMGMIYHRMGDQKKGRELMEKARDLDPHVWQTVMPPPHTIFEPM